MTFISDAAGAALSWNTGEKINLSQPEDRGVASLWFTTRQYFFVASLKWNIPMLEMFASNSTLLEAIGLLLPFLCIPQQLVGKYVLLLVDNEAVIYAWHKRMSHRDQYVSIFIQTLHMLEAALPCRIFTQYVKRCSTPEAILVDKLSRASTTDPTALAKIAHLKTVTPQGPLAAWLRNPSADWSPPNRIVTHIVDQLL